MTQQLIAATAAQLVELDHNQAVTSSHLVARFFGKQHNHVIRSIEKLECTDDFRRSNFGLANYLDAQGKPRKSYRITKDGFVFLAMGFTGREAAVWKERYIDAFNQMEQSLRSQEAGAFLRVQKELAQVQRRLIATQRALIAAGRRELKLLRAARPLPPAADGQLGLGL